MHALEPIAPRNNASMANLVTFARLLLLYVVVALACQPSAWLQLLNVPLLILVFVSDALDGWLARRLGETSRFGAIFDIASDRAVELSLWVLLVHLGLVPLWVALVFIARGTIVDAIRASGSAEQHIDPFGLSTRAWSRWLVAGRGMRTFYAVLKAVTFCWLLLLQPLPVLVEPALWQEWVDALHGVANVLVLATLLICLARGIPVIIEFLLDRGRELDAPAR